MHEFLRTIRLRRAPVIHTQEGVFVPRLDERGRDEVRRRWATLCEKKSARFDGRILHVLGVHRNGHGGATIHTIDCAYRYYAVQDDSFDLGIRPLGVKGLILHEDGVLLGKRSQQVRWYSGRREFVPGGLVEPNVDPSKALERELAEEAGLRLAKPPIPLAILYDPKPRTWDVIYCGQPLPQQIANSLEYECAQWEPLDAVASFSDLTPTSRSMLALMPLAAAVLLAAPEQPPSSAPRIV